MWCSVISVRLINADPSRDLLEAAFTCRGKEYANEKLSYDSAVKWFIAEHSPVEALQFRIILTEQQKPVVAQFVRHTAYHPRHWVQSSRPDWNDGQPRNPDALIRYGCQYDPLALIEMMRKRLCLSAESETRKQAQRVKRAFCQSDDPILKAMGLVMVPHCVYRAGCPEMKSCGWFKKYQIRHVSIHERYKEYLYDCTYNWASDGK